MRTAQSPSGTLHNPWTKIAKKLKSAIDFLTFHRTRIKKQLPYLPNIYVEIYLDSLLQNFRFTEHQTVALKFPDEVPFLPSLMEEYAKAKLFSAKANHRILQQEFQIVEEEK